MNKYEKDNIARLRPYLAECAVLLKKDGAFPLEGPCRIAAFGSGVRDTVKGGTGSGEVNSRYFVSIEQGLKDAGFVITNPYWPDMFEAFSEREKERRRSEIRKKARRDKVNIIAASMGAVAAGAATGAEVKPPLFAGAVGAAGRWGGAGGV